ncbi:MAG TPA: hypothetical protein VNO14_15105, partial [Blastocatellia bacterium]|nr:hypothetical protein [Blastocatellia bacterium]
MKPHRHISILTIALVAVSSVASFTPASGSADDSYRDVLLNTNENGEVRRWEITGPWGGDVRSLVVAPDNPDLLFLGTTDG